MATKQEWKERIEIIQAWIDGKEVQLKDGTEDWEDYANHPLSDPSFFFNRFDFRIKPSPREVYEVTTDDGVVLDCFKQRDKAQRLRDNVSGIGSEYQARVVKYREVLEDE